MERTAWLFTRGPESVRVEVRATSEGVQLIIDGPGAITATHHFPVGTSIESFREDYEQKLRAEGFRLQVVAERRSDDVQPPDGAERRRYSNAEFRIQNSELPE
jgi:hypothetical protein